MPKGQRKTKQSSLQTAGLLPTLKKPRLEEMLDDKGPEDVMAVRLSHVPPCVRYGV